MRILLFTLLSLACSVTLAATVYKWIDENGVVHYSDQPRANAEKIQVQAVQTYKASQAAGGRAPPPSAQPADAPTAAYAGCSIGQPFDGQDFANIDSLGVAVRTEPSLRQGDQVFITLDGALVNGGAATGPQFTLTNIERGTHALSAVVRDADGQLLCQTAGVSFNVHQASIRNPVNPVRPH